jgi:hypothetical protein
MTKGGSQPMTMVYASLFGLVFWSMLAAVWVLR